MILFNGYLFHSNSEYYEKFANRENDEYEKNRLNEMVLQINEFNLKVYNGKIIFDELFYSKDDGYYLLNEHVNFGNLKEVLVFGESDVFFKYIIYSLKRIALYTECIMSKNEYDEDKLCEYSLEKWNTYYDGDLPDVVREYYKELLDKKLERKLK